MGGEEPRRHRRDRGGRLRRAAGEGTTQHALDLRPRDAARPQQHRPVCEARDDGRFHADPRRPAIEDQVDPPLEVGAHVFGPGGADPAGAVGRRRHYRLAKGLEQRTGDRMVRHAQRHAVEPGAGEARDTAP